MGASYRGSLSRSRATWLRKTILYLCLTAFAVWILFPLWFTFQSSLTSIGSLKAIPPQWLPADITLNNYQMVLTGETTSVSQGSTSGHGSVLLESLFASGVIGLVVVMINLLIGGPAAYAYSRYRWSGWRAGYGFLLVSRVVPTIAIIVPYFVLFRVMGLIGSPIALVISYNVFTIPLTIWLLKGYFDTVPIELEEAAIVDGASKPRILWSVIVPISRPALVAVGLLVFLESWSEFFYALILTNQLTVPPLLATYNSFLQFNWSTLSAAIIVALVVPMTLGMVFQRYIVTGLTAGSGR